MEIFKFHRFVAASESDDVRGNGFVPSNRRTQLLFYRAERNRSSRKHVLFLPSNHYENVNLSKIYSQPKQCGESRFFSTIFIQIFLPRLLPYLFNLFSSNHREKKKRKIFFNIVCPHTFFKRIVEEEEEEEKKVHSATFALLTLFLFSGRHRSLIYSSASGPSCTFSRIRENWIPGFEHLCTRVSNHFTWADTIVQSRDTYSSEYDSSHEFEFIVLCDERSEYQFRIALNMPIDIYRRNIRVFTYPLSSTDYCFKRSNQYSSLV